MAHPAVVPLEVRRHPTRSARDNLRSLEVFLGTGGVSDGRHHRTGLGRDDPLIVSSTIRGAFDRKRRHPLHRRPRSHEPTRRAWRPRQAYPRQPQPPGRWPATGGSRTR